MNFKRLGNFGIAFTVALLALNLYLNRSPNLSPLGTGPAGFPWPTDGLGRVTVGMEGSFRIELEERIPTAEGSQRVPKMTAVGIDPGPESDGMSFRQALVTSLAIDDESPQIIARAPRAWAAILSDADGTRFDRTQPWRMDQPIVRFPGLAGDNEFVLTADMALLDPVTNEVHCPGAFTLTSTGMEWNGTGLRLDPATGVIHFGEKSGDMDWTIAGKDVQYRGHTDGGGSFIPLSENHYELQLHSIDSCWMNIPLAGDAMGRLETQGLRVTLEDQGGNWMPQTLAGDGQTYWTSPEHTFTGGTVDGTWNEQQQLTGLLVDGPLVGQTFGDGGGWLTAVGGAWIDQLDPRVQLWDRVTVDRLEGQVQSQRVEIGPNNQLIAEGDPFLLSQHGMLFADRLTNSEDGRDLLASSVLAYPASAQIDTMRSPSVVLSEDGKIHSPTGFEMDGVRGGHDWQLRGNELHATNGEVPILAQAFGAVEWKVDNGRILGDRVEILDNGQITARGNPMLAAFPVEGGSAIGSAESCFLSDEKLCLTGSPNVDYPAVALGLAGSRCLVAADLVYRHDDGRWSFLGNVVFSGSCSGTAQKMYVHADGSMEIHRSHHDKAFNAKLRNGQSVIAKAGWMKLHADGLLELKENLDMTLVTIDGQTRRLQGHFGEMSPDRGWVTGRAQLWADGIHAKANRLWWDTDEFGKTMLHLEGHASFAHEQATGNAHRIDLDPDTQEIELHRSARRKARLDTTDGRIVQADWIRLDPLRMLISSRHGTVTKVPPIQ